MKKNNCKYNCEMTDGEKSGGAAPVTENVASATECTGLMPALPQEEAGETENEKEENLAGLYGVLPAGDGDEG